MEEGCNWYLGIIPSRNTFYNKFDRPQGECDYGDIWSEHKRKELEHKLEEYGGISSSKDRIMKAYYCACTMKGEEPFEDAPCYFFYYWMRNMVPKDSHTYTLPEVLNAIYQTQGNVPCENRCSVKYDDVEEDLFKKRKEVFDYSYDYKIVEKELQKGESDCEGKWSKYLRDVASACDAVSAKCQRGNSNEPHYCSDFNKKYRDYCDDKLPELESLLSQCNPPKPKPNPNPNQAGSSGSFSDAAAENLPSKIADKELNNPQNLCKDSDNVPEKIRRALKEENGEGEYTKKLKEVWCYASDKENKGTLSQEQRCGFLYYWIGNTLWSTLDNTEFWDVMSAVYSELKQLPDIGERCNIVCSHINRDLFTFEKQVYEYYKDRGTMEAKLNQSSGYCSEEYSNYLKNAVLAYRIVEAECKGNSATDNSKCGGFMGKYGKNSPKDFISKSCDPILKDLPSTMAYKEIREGKISCGDGDSLPSVIETAWNLNAEESESIEYLKKVWCQARTMKGDTLSQEERCHFSYYYIGDMFYNSFKSDESFQSFMDTVSTELQKLGVAEECKIERSRFENFLFKYEKEVYDYYRDLTAIEKGIAENESKCTAELDRYLVGAKEAYTVIGGQCGRKLREGTDYCTKFKDEYSKRKPEDLIKTKCLAAKQLEARTVVRSPPAVINIGPEKEDKSVSTTPAAVSSVLTFLGLPTILFFLYKVIVHNYN
ncbi:KIR protein [Plasmodium coatneyi]|uniref:KIR protein n=1 Tax=Plasmodium coatneyi TaxID=208452 RepID=A0A1B1DUJ1_9APIC|nr:KIR protein [Plasmodium coatneyi]ANQ06287.1 KIR protein [Plasmodium coatneyi]